MDKHPNFILFQCTVCNISIIGIHSMRLHINSKRHRRKLTTMPDLMKNHEELERQLNAMTTGPTPHPNDNAPHFSDSDSQSRLLKGIGKTKSAQPLYEGNPAKKRYRDVDVSVPLLPSCSPGMQQLPTRTSSFKNSGLNNIPKIQPSSTSVIIEGEKKTSIEFPLPGTSHPSGGKSHVVSVQELNPELSYYVKGFYQNTTSDDLRYYFERFGPVKNIKMGKNNSYAIVAYSHLQQNSLEKLSRKQHFFNGTKLYVAKSVQTRRTSPYENETEEFLISHEALRGVGSFDKQLEILQSLVQPNFQEVSRHYNNLCHDLHRILSSYYVNCQVHPFGSTITGLGFKDSDVDIHISGIVINKHSKDFLYKSRSLLQRAELFDKLIVISQAKVPILKCHYVQYDLNCDINFTNKFGIYNSKLISHYVNSHRKLKLLMILVKYWAKVFKLTGMSHLLKNYALVWMFLFYLQQEFNYPSVRKLQSGCEPFFYSGWNAAFSKQPIDSKSIENMTCLALFKGFLEFFLVFDFEKSVICPYLGKPVSKECFENSETVPLEFEFYHKNNEFTLNVKHPICVQDPFEHTRNVTCVTKNILDDFLDVCKITIDKIKENEGEEDLLYNLVTYKYTKTDSKFTATRTLKVKNYKYIKEQLDEVQTDYSEKVKQLWFDTLKEVTKLTLKDIYRIDTEEIKCEEVPNQLCLKCVGVNLKLFQSRPKAKPYNHEFKSLLDIEKEITDNLMKKKVDFSESDRFECELHVHLMTESDEAVLLVKKFRGKKKSKCVVVDFLNKFSERLMSHQEKLDYKLLNRTVD